MKRARKLDPSTMISNPFADEVRIGLHPNYMSGGASHDDD